MVRNDVRNGTVNMRLLACVALAFALAAPVNASAAAFDVVKSGVKADIVVSGELLRGDEERFAAVAGTLDEDTTVWLAGPGGALQAALRIGTAIRLKGWRTAVQDGASCASACGLMWLGGIRRSVGQGAVVGFHAAWIETPEGRKQETGAGNALVGSYLNRLGLTDAAVVFLTSAAPDEAAWLSPTVASRVGIRAEFGVAGRPERSAMASPVPRSPSETATPSPPDVPTSPTPEALLRQLYSEFPWSVRLPQGWGCVGQSCKVRLLGADAWTGPDGVPRRIVVGVAEIKDGCHACEAILGIGVFRLETQTWRAESITPAATGVGAFGAYGGAVTFIPAGPSGRVVRIEDSDIHQGVVDAMTSLLMPVKGKYRRVLNIPTMHDLGGYCDVKEPACRRQADESNYSSTVSVLASGDGLTVSQTFTSVRPVPPAAWTVSAEGVAVQTVGGKASAGSTAVERAAMPDPAYSRGRDDRVAYEAWISGLATDARVGADSWAGRRSLRTPGNCDPPPGRPRQWEEGCAAARQKLAPVDARRKTEPEYRRGWNSR